MTERKNILITGAARGMGRAMAIGLARRGMGVALMDRNGEGLAGVEEEILAEGGTALALPGDITDEWQVTQAVARMRSELGPIFGVINNAGIGRDTIRSDFLHVPIKLWEINFAQWRAIVEVNINGFFLVSRAVLPGMVAANAGRIVTVSTSLDTMLRGGSATYGGSKAATEAFMAILAEDLAGTGVTANVLVPGGPVNTPMIPDDGKLDRTKMIQPEAMVEPAAWLLSDEAASVTNRRFIAARWSEGLEACSAPIGWPQLGRQMIFNAGPAAVLDRG